MNDIYDQLQIEDMTPDLKMLAKVIGMEAIRNTLRHFYGMSFYIPKISRFDGFIIRYINQHTDMRYKEIALRIGVSEQFVKNLAMSRFN